MKKDYDNRGFSLVEIIIVVAIMSILTATVSYGLSFSSGKPAEECARKLTSELQEARITTLGKNKVIITLENNSSDGLVLTKDIYIKDTATPDSHDRSVVGAKRVTLEYNTGSGYTPLAEGSSISFEFSRSTGALKPISDGGSEYYRYFKISKANKTMYIEIIPLTGKISTSATNPAP